jgi:2-hydroxychromene-2-carboxylate isomerase
MRTPLLAEPAALRRVAADLGLDVARFESDMASPGVQAELDRTRALADLFGFFGTPGLVIGRTVLNGAVSLSLLRLIVGAEKELPLPPC